MLYKPLLKFTKDTNLKNKKKVEYRYILQL